MRWLMLLAALAPFPAAAQINNPPAGVATQAQLQAVQSSIPAAANTAPPSVADSSATGTMTQVYALANHTHASKARKGRVLVPIAGFADVVFGTPFAAGTSPLCVTTAETTAGDTNVVNSQIDGVTTATGFRMRVTRTAITVASYTHYICIEP